MTKDNIQNFRETSRAYSDASIFMHEAIARKAGLSSTDHKYLGLILKYESITAGEISKLTGLTTGAVTGLIDRLEKKELIKRQFIKEDRRKVIIIPNVENSMKLLGPVFEELQQNTLALISGFSKKEIETIERYFREATVLMKETADHLNNP
ncbi:DNA-binding MarR family transcriptional regulator [Chryseobacterium bernardetii]|jgi:DNA-binding MarR family transcriptional regulator|uniref:DNA-binding MarR family transcriptional regulator n=2 Tax=Chryseobacterium TaxID=59732 RepID=A0A543EHB1_9FLAO|nr:MULTISPECIES: MarR family transcriptional regulator [Chryseobacterium]MDR6370973.1 DNA-binding MarR family transcriptional regulator [Chryseobacterium vietnamense]MDR6441281.1 DNA-binding MarR family transcriptional regulator [Chryseobacterium bernardetii]TQM20964.1 DNA-binding MarR family transcriptional regulator [Chryseobacterium aquifrigidense]